MRSSKKSLYTVGHGTASANELAALLRGAGVASLVDVRTVPKSSRHPQFWREELERWIPELAGSTYEWKRDLGGFRRSVPESPNFALRHPSFRGYADYMDTEPFRKALHEVLEHAAQAQTAVMCSESVWWRCHRRLISDAAQLLCGFEVLHLMHDGKLRPHVPTPGARVAGPDLLRYDDLTGEGLETS